MIVNVEGRNSIGEVSEGDVLENEESEESEESEECEDKKTDAELMGEVDLIGQDEGNIKDFRLFHLKYAQDE